LILGSASPELSRQAAESLAGRVEIIEMRGFDLNELPPDAQEKLWNAEAFRAPIWPPMARAAWRGARISSARSWSAISPRWDLAFRRP